MALRGWPRIAAGRFENLAEDELRDLELAENVQRLDLESYESSKERMREIEVAVSQAVSTDSAEKPKRGRPSTSRIDAAAKASDIRASTIREARKHVSVADEFPALQSPDWKKSHVMRADELLEEIGDDHRETFGKMISEPGIACSAATLASRSVGSSTSWGDSLRGEARWVLT